MGYSNNLRWCKRCGVPLLQIECENCGQEGVKVCSDFKPMFNEECEFLEKETGRKLPGKSWQDGLWMRYKTIWFNGERLARLSANGKPAIKKDYSYKDNLYNLDHYVTPEILYKANKSTLDELEKEAILFIKEIIKSYPKRKLIVSFSGGKDSTVVSYLVRIALGTDNVHHIFADTTMEYPDTYKYIKNFSRKDNKIPFYKTSNKNTFFDMCQLIEPPSRIKAWCCTVFKAAPIANILNYVNGNDGVISFEGIRKRESVRRRNLGRIYDNKKIAHQISVFPILDWKEIEVWLYILTRHLRFNDSYSKGFYRVGCMYCPNNAPYTDYLIKAYFPKEFKKWFDFLREYSQRIGKSDPEDYILSEGWKKRVGKSIPGESPAKINKRPCTDGDNITNYILNKSFSEGEIVERFKPFGIIEKTTSPIGYSYIVRDFNNGGESLFMFQGTEGFNRLRVIILVDQKKKKLIEDIERTIKRLQSCILCGGCKGICPQNAISVDSHFSIKETLCTHCGRCLSSKYLPFGCVTVSMKRQWRN